MPSELSCNSAAFLHSPGRGDRRRPETPSFWRPYRADFEELMVCPLSPALARGVALLRPCRGLEQIKCRGGFLERPGQVMLPFSVAAPVDAPFKSTVGFSRSHKLTVRRDKRVRPTDSLRSQQRFGSSVQELGQVCGNAPRYDLPINDS